MTNDLHEKLLSRKFKQNYQPPDENIIFTIDGKNIGCLQSFVCFQGLPKAGKSTFITSAIASAFTTWDIFGMKLNFPPNRKRICYIDTESSDFAQFWYWMEYWILFLTLIQLNKVFILFSG